MFRTTAEGTNLRFSHSPEWVKSVVSTPFDFTPDKLRGQILTFYTAEKARSLAPSECVRSVISAQSGEILTFYVAENARSLTFVRDDKLGRRRVRTQSAVRDDKAVPTQG